MEDKIIGREDVKKLRSQGIINMDNEIRIIIASNTLWQMIDTV